jgi:hypothetical protein
MNSHESFESVTDKIYSGFADTYEDAQEFVTEEVW